MNSIGERILLRPNIVYDIIKYILPALVGTHPAVRVPSTEACDVEPEGCAMLPNERLLITAHVDDVPVLSENLVLNEFLIAFDSECTTHTFNTVTYLDNYKVCKSLTVGRVWLRRTLQSLFLGMERVKNLVIFYMYLLWSTVCYQYDNLMIRVLRFVSHKDMPDLY